MPITYNQTGVTYDAAAYTFDGEAFQPTVFPIAGVYIAFTDGPYVASPAWTEVTTYVRSITTHRGRASDLDQFDTGTAQLVLDNRDRRFDPFYTSGPYYTNLVPRRQIRIVGQIGGTTYEVFRGFIAGWPVTWSEAGKDSTVTIQCFDALGLMANEQVPTDWPGYVIESLTPTHYFKCNDARSTATVLDRPAAGEPNLTMTFTTGGLKFENPPLADGCVSNSLYVENFLPATGTRVSTDQPDLTVTALLSNPNTNGSNNQNLSFYTRNMAVIFIWSTTGTITIQAINNGNQRQSTYAGQIRSQPVFIAISVTANAGSAPAITFYINNVAQTATSSTTSASSVPGYELFQINYGVFQEVAAWARALTTTQITNIYNALTARVTETTSARMQRLLDTTSWPAALESFPASPVGTVAEIGSGTGVIPELQLVADSEGGELYVSKTGVLTMTARRDVFNATRSANVQATFTDSGAGIRYGTELEIQYDADNLKNDITVSYSGDGEVNATSTAVVAGYGAAAAFIETQLDSPTSAQDLATLELGVEGVLIPQISPIDVSPNTAAADWQSILGLELLDRVNFKRTPTVGNQFNRNALVNAIDHQIEPGVWRTQLTLSMRYTSPLTLDDDVLGTLDFNYLG